MPLKVDFALKKRSCNIKYGVLICCKCLVWNISYFQRKST